MIFPPSVLLRFFFLLIFRTLLICVVVWISLDLSCLSLLNFLHLYLYIFHQSWKVFRLHFFKYLLSTPFSFPLELSKYEC